MSARVGGVEMWGGQEDGSNKMSRAVERAQWQKEVYWQRLLAFLHHRSDEPFYFLSRGRKIFDIVSTVALVVACIFCSITQFRAGSTRVKNFKDEFVNLVGNQTSVAEIKYLLENEVDQLRNDTSAQTVVRLADIVSCLSDGQDMRQRIIVSAVLLTGYGVTILVHFSIFLLSSVQFQLVFPRRKLGFHWKRTLVDQSPGKTKIPYSPVYLAPTVRALRKMVEDVQEGTIPLDSPTKFLLSANGRQFLNRATKRLHDKIQLYDNEFVRINRRGTISFFLVTLICVTLGMTAAYEDSSATTKCVFRTLLLAFMEKFSFTLLAAFAVASFAGVSQYSQLTCVREKMCRLTDDEKFLISLIAANSDEPFTGIERTESSGYAIIEDPGNTKVFMPIHASLFAYKMARTLDIGETRLYNRNAPDCFGNYEMT